jgi:hypothetical protein
MKQEISEKNEKSLTRKQKVTIVILIIFILINITTITILYFWESTINSYNHYHPTADKVVKETNDTFLITIKWVSDEINIEEIQFIFENHYSSLDYGKVIGNSSPSELDNGEFIIYPIPADKPINNYSYVFQKGTNGIPVNSSTNLNNFSGCYFAYCDRDSDNMLTWNDQIWLYKDWNDDGTQDLQHTSTFSIWNSGPMPIIYVDFDLYLTNPRSHDP